MSTVTPSPAPETAAEPAPRLSAEESSVVLDPAAAPAQVQARAHRLSVTLLARGGTPLLSQAVLILHPDTGQPIGDPVTTDDQGHLDCAVPEDLLYDLRILDDDADDLPPPEEESPADPAGDDPPRLYLRLCDAARAPRPGVPYQIRGEDLQLQGQTDEHGDLEVDGCPAGPYTLTVAGQDYPVHTLWDSDLVEDPEPYTVLLADPPASEGAHV